MRRTVIIVEPDRDLREALTEALSAEGFFTVQARGSAEAGVIARKAPRPCTILLDWNPLAAPDGVDALVKDGLLDEVRVVIATTEPYGAPADPRNRIHAVVRKPMNLDAMIEVLDGVSAS